MEEDEEGCCSGCRADVLAEIEQSDCLEGRVVVGEEGCRGLSSVVAERNQTGKVEKEWVLEHWCVLLDRIVFTRQSAEIRKGRGKGGGKAKENQTERNVKSYLDRCQKGGLRLVPVCHPFVGLFFRKGQDRWTG